MKISRPFEMNVFNEEAFTYIWLCGYLSEENILPAFFNYRPLVIIDTKNVEMINSCGLRDLLDWVSKITGQIFWIRCSPAIVTVANEVYTLLDTGVIVNFFIPYFCDVCKTGKNILVSPDEVQTMDLEQPLCDECKGVLVFDEPLPYYLSFLANVKKGLLPSDILKHVELLMAKMETLE